VHPLPPILTSALRTKFTTQDPFALTKRPIDHPKDHFPNGILHTGETIGHVKVQTLDGLQISYTTRSESRENSSHAFVPYYLVSEPAYLHMRIDVCPFKIRVFINDPFELADPSKALEPGYLSTKFWANQPKERRKRPSVDFTFVFYHHRKIVLTPEHNSSHTERLSPDLSFYD